jgi:hypothetical protein
MRRIVIIAAVLGLLAMVPTAAESGTDTGTSADASAGLSPTARQLLQTVKATAQYREIEEALDDNYQNINVFAPGQGCHYLNSRLLDAQFDHRRPELLVYAEFPGRDPQLVSVEYAVPISVSPSGPPQGFAGDFDVWFRNETFGLWTLHAWVWLPSTDGVLVADNPLAPQEFLGCGGEDGSDDDD